MPALDGAFALAQNLDVAVLVGQHLELDVARRLDQLFHVDIGDAKAACASCWAWASRAADQPGSRTTRMPRPPPPAEAFSITG